MSFSKNTGGASDLRMHEPSLKCILRLPGRPSVLALVSPNPLSELDLRLKERKKERNKEAVTILWPTQTVYFPQTFVTRTNCQLLHLVSVFHELWNVFVIFRQRSNEYQGNKPLYLNIYNNKITEQKQRKQQSSKDH